MKRSVLSRNNLSALLFFLLGILIMLFPRAIIGIDMRRIGTLLMGIGALSLFLRARSPVYAVNVLNIACAIAALLAGIVLFARYHSILYVLPTATGLLVFVRGIACMLLSHWAGRQGSRKWLLPAFLSLLVAGIGLFIFIHLFMKTELAIRYIGFSFICSGLAEWFVRRL